MHSTAAAAAAAAGVNVLNLGAALAYVRPAKAGIINKLLSCVAGDEYRNESVAESGSAAGVAAAACALPSAICVTVTCCFHVMPEDSSLQSLTLCQHSAR
jgi:hypothetical protein